MGIKLALFLLFVVTAAVAEAQNWPYSTSYKDGGIYPNWGNGPLGQRRSGIVTREDDEADDQVVVVGGDKPAGVTKSKVTSVKPDSSKVAPKAPAPNSAPAPVSPPAAPATASNKPAIQPTRPPTGGQPPPPSPKPEEEEESEESDEDGQDFVEYEDEGEEEEEAEEEEVEPKPVKKGSTPKIQEVVKVVKKSKKKAGSKNPGNVGKEVIVPGYVTNYGEVLVPLDTVLREHDQQHVSIIPDSNVKRPGVRAYDEQEDESEEDTEVPYPLAYYVDDDYFEDSAEEEEEEDEPVEAPPKRPLQYIPAKAPTGEDDEWDATKPKYFGKPKLSHKVKQRTRADLPVLGEGKKQKVKKVKATKKKERNEVFTDFPPSRTPELYAVIKSQVPAYATPMVSMDVSSLYGPNYYRPVVRRPQVSDERYLEYLIAKYYAQRRYPTNNRVYSTPYRRPVTPSRFQVVRIQPSTYYGPETGFDSDFEPVYTRPTYYRPSYSPQYSQSFSPYSAPYYPYSTPYDGPSYGPVRPQTSYTRRPVRPQYAPFRPYTTSQYKPVSRPSYGGFGSRPSYGGFGSRPSYGGFGPSYSGRPQIMGGFSQRPVQHQDMDKVVYSKPSKGSKPMTMAQYIAQVNRKPTPVVSLKNDPYPPPMIDSSEESQSQADSADDSAQQGPQVQGFEVMPENESEIEERSQGRPYKSLKNDPLNIMGKINQKH